MATFAKRTGPHGRTVYQVRIRVRGYPPLAKTFDRKSDARAWAAEVESEMRRGIYIDRRPSESATVGDLVRRYLAEVTPAKRGAIWEHSHARALLAAPLASLSVAMCTGRHIAEYRDARLKAVSASTVNRELNILSHVFTVAAMEWGYHLPAGNPVHLCRRPKVPASTWRNRRLLPGEESRLLAACAAQAKADRTIPIDAIVVIAIETAMRRGEIAVMRWEHLNGRTLLIPNPKTQVPRRVPLSRRALTVFDSLRRKREGYIWNFRAESIGRAFAHAVARARKDYEEDCARHQKKPDARMLRNLRFHDLRHEGTSRLAKMLPNVIELAAVTGHQDLKMLRRYYHPDPEELAAKLK